MADRVRSFPLGVSLPRTRRTDRIRHEPSHSASDLFEEVRSERDSPSAFRLGQRHLQKPLLFSRTRRPKPFHLGSLSPAQLAPSKSGAECQATHEPMRLRQREQLRCLFIGQPIRWPFLQARHYPPWERTTLNKPRILAPVQQASHIRQDVKHRRCAELGSGFKPEKKRPHVLAFHPFEVHVPEERDDEITNTLSREFLALLAALRLDVRLPPALARGTHRATFVGDTVSPALLLGCRGVDFRRCLLQRVALGRGHRLVSPRRVVIVVRRIGPIEFIRVE